MWGKISSKGTKGSENPVGDTTQELGLCFYHIGMILWKLTANLGHFVMAQGTYTVKLYMPKTYRKNTHLLSNTYYQRHSEHFLHMSLSKITSENVRLLEVHEYDQS